jgi:hypothetical protein
MDEEIETPIAKVNLNKITNPLLREMIEAGLIDEQGIRIAGLGILIRKTERMIQLQDKTNLNLFHMEKKMH